MNRLARVLPALFLAATIPACGSGGTPGGPEILRNDVPGDLPVDSPFDPAPDGPARDLPVPGDSADPGSPDTPADAPAEFAVDFPADGPTDGQPDAPPDLPVDTAGCPDASDCAALGAPPACTGWTCDDGACRAAPGPDGVSCDDGNPCTVGDACHGGTCTGAPLACAEDDDPCTTAACAPDAGCVQEPLTGDPCDDGSACTDPDQCILGRCTGRPLPCDDGDPCTLEGCDALAGCTHAPLEGSPCDDADACTGGDTCRLGTCTGDFVDCDDGLACTRDSCAPATGCRHDLLDGPGCDDGSTCTTGDRCRKGVCAGDPVDCNDGNPCTRDLCDLADGCLHLPADGTPCNDGNPCTDTDTCVAGACLGSAGACDDGNPCTLDGCTAKSGCIHTQPSGLPCDDGNACTSDDRCSLGACVPGAPVSCDDANPCTTDSCDPGAGCLHAALSTVPCDAPNACTTNTYCYGGRCRGVAVSCDDSNPCTSDSCDPAAGCLHAPIDGDCDDGDPCTAGDRCSAGTCQRGGNPQCLAVHRIVLAGDSWSTGLILPLRDALDARGYEEVTVSWETTSRPGTTVAQWLHDSTLVESIALALDQEPPAEMLIFTLGGNDYLGACRNGLGLANATQWILTMAGIQADLQQWVSQVRSGRPGLKVVNVGYDYLSLPMIEALGSSFPGFDWVKFNLGLVDLSTRQRDIGLGTPNMVYAHNLGVLQNTFGDSLFGYGPGAAPHPGPAPTYSPFPGGWYTYPSPANHIPDGIHPDAAGFRAIIENTLDQGAAAWIEGRPWP